MSVKLQLLKRVDQLPKTFSLENYAGVEFLDSKGWAQVLNSRELTNWRSDNWLAFESAKKRVHHDDPEMESLFSDPLHKSNPGNLVSGFWTGEQKPIERISISKFQQISHDAFESEIDASKLRYKEFEELNGCYDENPDLHDEFDNTESKELEKPLDSFQTSHLSSDEIYLTVNLNCSDKQLSDYFQEILHSARLTRSTPQAKQAFTKKNFYRWFRLGVLPYIDLTDWAKRKHVIITQNLMGEVLFPNDAGNGTDTTETIRKTVKPLAEKLLMPETIDTLWAQAELQKEV